MTSRSESDRGAPERPGGALSARARWATAIGLVAASAVVLTLDRPGLTVDEPLDVRPGRAYWRILREEGRHFLDSGVVDRVFRDNAEHPPLGRWLLGLASTAGEPFEVLLKGPDPTGSYVLAGRMAPALTFGALTGLVAWTAIGRWGLSAGLAAAFALLAMPRVFAHAHLGALDTFLAMTWTSALLAGERALKSARPVRAMAAAGAVWSLALLTKIHAWLLIPVLAVWAPIRLGPRRAAGALTAWFVTGVSLFWVGWPWLWYHPWARLLGYWGTGVERLSIRVQYFGAVYADRDVPWHYPWFYFAVTVPVGLHLLGLVGLVHGWKLRREEALPLLLAETIAFFLLVFSTRVPIYDGERLFLHVFPAWALLIGYGFSWLRRLLGANRLACRGLDVFLLAQATGLLMTFPFGLSYYNLLVGGLPGARGLGLEVTYWSDPIDDVLLDRLASMAPRDGIAAMVPTLYPGQGVLTTGFNRTLARQGIILGDDADAARAEWVVVSGRSAYWPPGWRERIRAGGGQVVARRERQGVPLAELWHFPPMLKAGPRLPARPIP